MAIRLIAFDLDGTALRSSGDFPWRNRLAVDKAAAEGITVVPVTGRVLDNLPDEIKTTKSVKYVISANGASITDRLTGRQLYSDLIPPDALLSLFDISERYGTGLEIYIDGKAYAERKFLRALDGYDILGVARDVLSSECLPVDGLRDYVTSGNRQAEKVNIHLKKGADRDEVYAAAAGIDRISAISSGSRSIEFNSVTASKGAALRFLCGVLDIPQSQVMAIGDALNDYEMLRYSGLPIAVGNADERLRSIAAHTVPSNDEDGVAYAMEHYAL